MIHRKLQASQIERLLREPTVPWASVLREQGRALEVKTFLRYGAAHGISAETLEPAMAAFVRSRGGSRQQTIDLWAWIPNLVRRATGQPVRAAEQLWVLPPGVLD